MKKKIIVTLEEFGGSYFITNDYPEMEVMQKMCELSFARAIKDQGFVQYGEIKKEIITDLLNPENLNSNTTGWRYWALVYRDTRKTRRWRKSRLNGGEK